MGEIVGAQIYITEITKPPAQYPAVALIGVASVIGTMFALWVAYLVTTKGFDWRLAFWFGVCIAQIGSIARTRLRETPEFVGMKQKRKKDIKKSIQNPRGKVTNVLKNTNSSFREKVSKKTSLSFLFMHFPRAVWFFFAYIFCSNILKNKFGMTSTEIIRNNFFVSLV